MDDELIIRGSLEESSFPELLHSICKNKESGTLTCKSNEYMKTVYINEGQIVFANSSNVDDRLGESLLRYGKITVRQLIEGTKKVAPGKRLGAILCEISALTPEDLIDGVRNQVRDIIISLFEITRGQYELVLKPVDTHEMILLGMSTEDIIFHGVKSIQSWSRISKGIGSFISRPILADEHGKILMNLTMTPDESHLFSLCEKGQFTIEEICGMSYLSNFDTCRILWALVMVGALKPTELSQIAASPYSSYVPASLDVEYDLHDLVEKYNDLYSFIFDYAFQQIGEGAETLAGKAMSQVRETTPKFAKGLNLDKYGRLDSDTIMRNLGSVPEKDRIELANGALEEIMYAFLNEVGLCFGLPEKDKLALKLQKMRKP